MHSDESNFLSGDRAEVEAKARAKEVEANAATNKLTAEEAAAAAVMSNAAGEAAAEAKAKDAKLSNSAFSHLLGKKMHEVRS